MAFSRIFGNATCRMQGIIDTHVHLYPPETLLDPADWANRHPDTPLDGVAYSLSHLLNLSDLGITDKPPPGGLPRGRLDDTDVLEEQEMRDRYGPRPGLWAVFVRPLREADQRYEYFRFFEAFEVLGYTVYLYRLDSEDVQRYWQSRSASVAVYHCERIRLATAIQHPKHESSLLKPQIVCRTAITLLTAMLFSGDTVRLIYWDYFVDMTGRSANFMEVPTLSGHSSSANQTPQLATSDKLHRESTTFSRRAPTPLEAFA
jgi:hypothetical protein